MSVYQLYTVPDCFSIKLLSNHCLSFFSSQLANVVVNLLTGQN